MRPTHGIEAAMLAALSLHPGFTCDAVQSIVADVVLSGPSSLIVRYQVRGDPDAMTLPAPAAPERTDGLWRHTCLEAFAAEADGKSYVEFNFAPSMQWAWPLKILVMAVIEIAADPSPRL